MVAHVQGETCMGQGAKFKKQIKKMFVLWPTLFSKAEGMPEATRNSLCLGAPHTFYNKDTCKTKILLIDS